MAVAPNYFITGVWKDVSGKITHVLLHLNTHNDSTNSNSFGSGIKTAESIVISNIKMRNLVMTLRWSYQTATWQEGAKVEVVSVLGKEYLRTHKDATVSDNLDNMINMIGVVS